MPKGSRFFELASTNCATALYEYSHMACAIPTLIVAVAALSASSAFGQSAEEPVRVSAGFAMSFDVNPGRPDSEGGEFMSGALIAPALWTELELSNGSPVTLHTAFEMARSYQTRWRHPGSAGFDALIDHRDYVLAQTIGFQPMRSERNRFVVMGGFGLVFSRDARESTSGRWEPKCPGCTEFTFVTRTERSTETSIQPSFLGGINWSIALNQRTRLLARIRARITMRENEFLYGWLSITPGLGLQVGF